MTEHTGNPQISVLMTTLNSERFLREAMDSILCQSFEGFEFIIVDGGSTDSTAAIVNSIADRRIRFITEPGLRRSAQLNKAFLLSAGSYIAIMDSDDIAFPDRLERQKQILDAHPGIGIAGSWARLIRDDGTDTGGLYRPAVHEQIMRHLLAMNGISFGTSMCRRGVFASAGSFAETLPFSEDIDWLLRCARSCRFANLTEPLMKLRQHTSSRSRSSSLRDETLLRSLTATLINGAEYSTEPLFREHLDFNLGLIHYYYGQSADARIHFSRSFIKAPFDPLIMRYLLASLLPHRLLTGLRRSSIARKAAMLFRIAAAHKDSASGKRNA